MAKKKKCRQPVIIYPNDNEDEIIRFYTDKHCNTLYLLDIFGKGEYYCEEAEEWWNVIMNGVDSLTPL